MASSGHAMLINDRIKMVNRRGISCFIHGTVFCPNYPRFKLWFISYDCDAGDIPELICRTARAWTSALQHHVGHWGSERQYSGWALLGSGRRHIYLHSCCSIDLAWLVIDFRIAE